MDQTPSPQRFSPRGLIQIPLYAVAVTDPDEEVGHVLRHIYPSVSRFVTDLPAVYSSCFCEAGGWQFHRTVSRTRICRLQDGHPVREAGDLPSALRCSY